MKKVDEKFWAKYFKVYDVLNVVIPYQGLMQELEKELDLQASDVVLDVGSGTGNFILKIKNKCKKIIGVDFSEHGLKIHKTKDPEAEHMILDITQEFPFSDNYFSKIVSNNVIYTLNKNQQISALQEIFRILKPGGRFVISNVKEGFSPMEIYVNHIKESIKRFGVLRTSIIFFRLLIPTVKMFYYNQKIKNSGASKSYNFFAINQQKKILEEAGFFNVSQDKLVYSNQAVMNSCYKP